MGQPARELGHGLRLLLDLTTHVPAVVFPEIQRLDPRRDRRQQLRRLQVLVLELDGERAFLVSTRDSAVFPMGLDLGDLRYRHITARCGLDADIEQIAAEGALLGRGVQKHRNRLISLPVVRRLYAFHESRQRVRDRLRGDARSTRLGLIHDDLGLQDLVLPVVSHVDRAGHLANHGG